MAFLIIGYTPISETRQNTLKQDGSLDYVTINKVIRAQIEADSEADFPSLEYTLPNDNPDVRGSLIIGIASEAHSIASNKMYKLQSTGTWVEQDEAARSDVYTTGQVNQLLQDMSDAQTNVDLAQDADINANTDAIKALVDNPEPKNVLNLLSATTQTINGITFTVNDDYSVTFSGNNNTGNAAFFSIPVTIKPGSYYFSGMTEEGGSGSGLYRLELRSPTATGTVNLVNDNTTPTAWGPTATYTGYFNIRVASGTNIDPLEPKTVYPMIDLRWKHNISSAYVPYVPSNMDLYKMINP